MGIRTVKIKSWKDMAEEFEVNRQGHIVTPSAHFLKKMEKLLPTNRIITVDKLNQWHIDHAAYIISPEMEDNTIPSIYKTIYKLE